MISSVPYVPRDTMKNVAATRGQSVSLATFFLTVGITREGSWVGTDIELNFYSRPPKRNSLSPLRYSEFSFAEYKNRPRMQGEKAPERGLCLYGQTFLLLDERCSCEDNDT